MVSHFVTVNGINMHYLDNGGDKPEMLMLHSLTANAYVFQGLIANGLTDHFRLIIPDLRGRGQSGKALEDYSLETQAKDIIALLKHLEIEQVMVCGHSFGGLLGIYIAAHYPEIVSKLAILDVAAELNPLTSALISFSTSRLFTSYPGWDEYLKISQEGTILKSMGCLDVALPAS